MFIMIAKEKISFLDEIVSIEDVGKQQTYDFTIPKNHCYFANGVLVHNSGNLEEMADVVILLHWPFKYIKENQKLDRRKYTVIVAKNRNGPTGYADIHFKPEYYQFADIV